MGCAQERTGVVPRMRGASQAPTSAQVESLPEHSGLPSTELQSHRGQRVRKSRSIVVVFVLVVRFAFIFVFVVVRPCFDAAREQALCFTR